MKLIDFENSRYEKKFVVNIFSKQQIEHMIKMHPSLFSEIFWERRVNNIYFDSVSGRSYREHLAGIGERLKLRIRWYDDIFGKIEPQLEIKIKNTDLGNKKVYSLKSFVLDEDITGEKLMDVFLKSKLPEWLIEELKLSQPVLLNSYKRKYFLSRDRKFRICIDTDMIFYKIKNFGNLFLEKLKDNYNIVVELKYSIQDSKDAGKVTQYFPFRFSAISKFVRGLEGLEIVDF